MLKHTLLILLKHSHTHILVCAADSTATQDLQQHTELLCNVKVLLYALINIDSFICFLELAQGRSYWNRLRYLDLCEIAMELFSKSYFCKHFLIQALELVSDPVANVR